MNQQRLARLAFPEIAGLINNMQTTAIEPVPQEEKEGRWAIYKGVYKIQTSSYPFTVLNLYSGVTKADLQDLSRRHSLSSYFVVCPRSVAARPYVEQLRQTVRELWTTAEYLASFMAGELAAYRKAIHNNYLPSYFINPMIARRGDQAVRKNESSILLSLLLDRSTEEKDEGVLGIVLAEPGQGKTYLSQHLVTTLQKRDPELIPIMVGSEQWKTMSIDDHTSLWKTIVNSFKYCGSTIGWLDGCEKEFLQATLKADLFRIVFDGFDEYAMRNQSSFQPLDVLRALVGLVEETGAKLLITSRTSFWDANLDNPDVDRLLKGPQASVYRILPFDRSHAEEYFTKRLESEELVKKAMKIWSFLHENSQLVGRGFVLPLIADLAEGGEPLTKSRGAKGLLWLMRALCQRDIVRHKLPFSADQQLKMLRLFAAEVSVGESPDSALMQLAMEVVKDGLTNTERGDCIRSLEHHPLVAKDPSKGWYFKEEQIEMLLLAEHIVELSPQDLKRFVDKLKLSAGSRQDLIAMLIDLVTDLPTERAKGRLRELIATITTIEDQISDTLTASTGRDLGGLLALMAVGRYHPIGSPRADRAQFLVWLAGGVSVSRLNFSATIGSYDFREVAFEYCIFDQVIWDNCRFDKSTVFRNCQFLGGDAPVRSQGFGTVRLEECLQDQAAMGWIRSSRLREGATKYTREDLKRDLDSVLQKFVGKGGFGLQSVEEPNLQRGSISGSPYKNEIIDVLSSTILETHFISGTSEAGFNVREDAKDAMRFYIDNNNFIGGLRTAELRLLDKLGLD